MVECNDFQATYPACLTLSGAARGMVLRGGVFRLGSSHPSAIRLHLGLLLVQSIER
jgi:hypothetical protein